MSFGSFLKSLVPFIAKDVSTIDADAKAAIAKLQADTSAKVTSISLSAVVDKIKAQGASDIAAANASWKQHLALLEADVAAKVKAAQPVSVLLQLGLTGATGPSVASGTSGPTGTVVPPNAL